MSACIIVSERQLPPPCPLSSLIHNSSPQYNFAFSSPYSLYNTSKPTSQNISTSNLNLTSSFHMSTNQYSIHGDNFHVKLIRKTLVKAAAAAGPSPENDHIISLSNLDLLSGRFPVTYIYFYTTPHSININTLIDSLAQCLSLFYPFAGKISENSTSGEPEIICDNSGALVVEAHTNIPLKDFNFYDLNQSLQPGKLVSVDHLYPVQVQITNYTCGGISLTFTFDHALGDASAFSKFLVTWSEIATEKPVSCIPDHRRGLRPRDPPSYDPSLDEAFISCTMEDIRSMPSISVLLKRLYYIDRTSIEALQRLASSNNTQRTKIEAFSAYIWKVMANTINQNHKHCKMGWLVNGRTRLTKFQNSVSDYIGNVLSLAFAELDVMDLRKGSIADVADTIHNAISNVTNEAHFRNLIDWVECHRPGLMLSKNVLGLGGPTIVVSSGRRFPVAELDFGFGSPVLGTTCSTIERLGVGYINQRQSANRDGSWTVSAILWPEIVEALESDPDHIFQPMNLNHIQL